MAPTNSLGSGSFCGFRRAEPEEVRCCAREATNLPLPRARPCAPSSSPERQVAFLNVDFSGGGENARGLVLATLRSGGKWSVACNPCSADLLWADTYYPRMLPILRPGCVINHLPRSFELGHKAQFYKTMQSIAAPFFPTSYVMPADWQALCAAAKVAESDAIRATSSAETRVMLEPPLWIVKPARNGGGKQVRVLRSLDLTIADLCSSRRPVVVQRYVPGISQIDGYKFGLRVYAAIIDAHASELAWPSNTSFKGLAGPQLLVYREGSVRFASERLDFSDLSPAAHVTNNNAQRSSVPYSQGHGTNWSIQGAWRRHVVDNYGSARFEDLWAQVQRSLAVAVGAALERMRSQAAPHDAQVSGLRCFQLLGADFCVGSDFSHVWLLELNTMPALRNLTPNLKHEYEPDFLIDSSMIADLLNLVICNNDFEGVAEVPGLGGFDFVEMQQIDECRKPQVPFQMPRHAKGKCGARRCLSELGSCDPHFTCRKHDCRSGCISVGCGSDTTDTVPDGCDSAHIDSDGPSDGITSKESGTPVVGSQDFASELRLHPIYRVERRCGALHGAGADGVRAASKAYWDEHFKAQNTAEDWHMRAEQLLPYILEVLTQLSEHALNLTASEVEERGPLRILYLGCGLSRLGECLRDALPHAIVTCCDISLAAVEAARTRAEEAGGADLNRLEYLVADALNLPEEWEARFDCVVDKSMADSLGFRQRFSIWLELVGQMYKEVLRVLRPPHQTDSVSACRSEGSAWGSGVYISLSLRNRARQLGRTFAVTRLARIHPPSLHTSPPGPVLWFHVAKTQGTSVGMPSMTTRRSSRPSAVCNAALCRKADAGANPSWVGSARDVSLSSLESLLVDPDMFAWEPVPAPWRLAATPDEAADLVAVSHGTVRIRGRVARRTAAISKGLVFARLEVEEDGGLAFVQVKCDAEWLASPEMIVHATAARRGQEVEVEGVINKARREGVRAVLLATVWRQCEPQVGL